MGNRKNEERKGNCLENPQFSGSFPSVSFGHVHDNSGYIGVGQRINSGVNNGLVGDCKIVINIDNVSLVVNTSSINGDNNLIGDNNSISIGSTDEWQKILFAIYNRLDAVSQAELITYADRLSKKGGVVA